MEPRLRVKPAQLDESYPAALYAAVHSGTPGDIEFYRRMCDGATSVLELGCGSGRVAIPIASDGRRVVGLDSASGLLALARARSPELEWLDGDMRRFELGRTFDRILIPYNGIYCVLSEVDVIAVLRNAERHLSDHGMLIFDGYAADLFHEADEPRRDAWDDEAWVTRADALGTTWEVYERSRWNRDAQRIDARYRHVSADERPEITATIPQRYLLRDELPRLLAEAGLSLIEVAGGFADEADARDSTHRVVQARKATTA